MAKENQTTCADKGSKITRIIVFNKSDAVFDQNGFVRLKRKYGKLKRPVYAFNAKKS